MGEKISNLEKAFVIICILIFTGPIIPYVNSYSNPVEIPTKSDPLSSVVYGAIFLITLSILIYQRKSLKKWAILSIKEKTVVITFLVLLISIIWSIDVSSSIEKLGAIVIALTFGYYFSTRFNLKEQLKLIGITSGLIIIACFIIEIVHPIAELKIIYEGAWNGIYNHKNILGRVMNLSLLTFIALYSTEKRARFKALIASFSILAFTLLILSKSVGAILTFIVAFVIYISLWKIMNMNKKIKKVMLILGLAFCLVISGLMLVNYESILHFVGKDTTFTGRTGIWTAVDQKIAERPLLGYGFGAFWIPDSDTESYISMIIGWDTLHSHNLVRDLLLDVGFIGTTIILICFLIIYIRCFIYAYKRKDLQSLWPFSLLTTIMFLSVAESIFIRVSKPNMMFTILYVAIAYRLYSEKSNNLQK